MGHGEAEPVAHAAPDAAAEPDGGPATGASRYGFIALVAFFTYWTRYFLADRNSYWLDELYSVERYVAQYESVREAISSLADTSIHPPLYQFLLFYWVELFGDGETATRTLSNVYMTLAVIFLHRLVARLFDERLANVTALIFALTYAVTYYGLETRSYAQTLMLAVVSSYAVLVHLDGRPSPAISRVPRVITDHWAPVLLTVANVGLMLTHYYNFFFWGAQSMFVAAYILTRSPRGKRLKRLLSAVVLYLVQFLLFFALWGRVTLDSYARNTGRYAADSITYTPLEIITRVTNQNFGFGPLGRGVGGLLIAVLLVAAAARAWRRDSGDGRREIVGLGYLLAMTAGPATLVFLAFLTIGAERFAVRYVLYLVPMITVLLAVALREAMRCVTQLLSTRWPERGWLAAERHGPLVVTALLLAMVMPDAMRAASEVKDDWRGTARDIVSIVESNPEKSYVVYEPAFRQTPVYDYYFARYSDDVRVRATIRRWVEERGEGDYSFDRDEEWLQQHDFMIIPFVHHRTSDFPLALETLQARYDVQHWQIDDDGRGLVIFALS